MAGPQEVPKLKVCERHHQRENVNGGPPGGARAGDPGAHTNNVKMPMAGPREVSELQVWDVHHQRENIDDWPPGGARTRDPGMQCLRSPPLGHGGEWLQKPRDKCSKSS
jgi:hypothetical protein